MTQPSYSTSPNPSGPFVYTPKITGQVAISRQEISQYGSTHVGINIVANGVPVAPDSIKATVYQRVAFEPSDDALGAPTLIAQSSLILESVGVYSFILGPSFTSQLSLTSVFWQYSVGGSDYIYWDYYEVLEPMPTYDALSDNEKGVLRLVTNMFGDLYDSVDGGPHLKEEFQTHFGTERVAQCMQLSVHMINSTSQPYTKYTIGVIGGKAFPEDFYSILVRGTYLEVVKHLIRSYTEMPTVSGAVGVAMVDRQNYTDRWRAILQDEKDDFAKAVRSFKRSLLNLGGGNLIVSGGIFAQSNYFRPGGYSLATRGARFYPVSYVNVRA